jgi:heme A synthase
MDSFEIIIGSILLFFIAILAVVFEAMLRRDTKTSRLKEDEAFFPSGYLAVENIDALEKHTVETSQWLASLSLVLITIAVPLLLTQTKNLSKANAGTFRLLALIGLGYSFFSLAMGLLYKHFYAKRLRSDPNYVFSAKRNEPDGIPFVEFREVERKHQRSNLLSQLALQQQYVQFILGILFLISATVYYAYRI